VLLAIIAGLTLKIDRQPAKAEADAAITCKVPSLPQTIEEGELTS